jgi:toxin FitB
LADGPNATFFAPAVQATGELIVPTVSLYEVFKSVLRQRGEGPALQVAALMRQGRVVDLTADMALAAATISLAHGIPLADSIMLATARAYDAVLWSQDADFRGIEGVRYIAQKPRVG